MLLKGEQTHYHRTWQSIALDWESSSSSSTVGLFCCFHLIHIHHYDLATMNLKSYAFSKASQRYFHYCCCSGSTFLISALQLHFLFVHTSMWTKGTIILQFPRYSADLLSNAECTFSECARFFCSIVK